MKSLLSTAKNILRKTPIVNRAIPPPSPSLANIVIYANNYCNAKCPFCDVSTGISKGIARPLKALNRDMPLEILDEILSDPLLNGGEINFSFLMTEPLLNNRLPEMLRRCKSSGHWTMVTTNGKRLPDMAEAIAPFLDRIQVSLDGPESINDSFRGNGFFSSAIEGLRRIEKCNGKIEKVINCTVSQLNIGTQSELLKNLEKQDISINHVKFQLMDFVSESMAKKQTTEYPDIPQTPSCVDTAATLSDLDSKKLWEGLQEARRVPLSNIGYILFRPSLKRWNDISEYFSLKGKPIPRNDTCFTPWVSLAINTDGKAFWHMRCFNDYELGDLMSGGGLTKIFLGEKARFFREKLRGHRFCFPACTRCCGVMKAE